MSGPQDYGVAVRVDDDVTLPSIGFQQGTARYFGVEEREEAANAAAAAVRRARPRVPLSQDVLGLSNIEIGDGYRLGDVGGAAARTENSVASVAQLLGDGMDVSTTRQSGYSAWADIQGTPYANQWEVFADSPNPQVTAMLKTRVDREIEDHNTLRAAGPLGFLAALGAGVADPTNLIPVGGELKLAASGVWSIRKSALNAAMAGALGASLQEGLLQGSQETRTIEEGFINIGTGVVLAGLLGGGVAGVMTRAERVAAGQALENMARGADAAMPQGGRSVGAAEIDRFSLDDLSMSTAEGFGGAAEGLAKASQVVSPNLQSQFSPSPTVREVSQSLAENTLYQRMHDGGRTLGASAETNARVVFEGRSAAAVRESNAIFNEGRKGGLDLNKQEFEEAVGAAMRRGDQHPNAFVARAAQAWRKNLIEPYQNDALHLGLLDESDLDVKTAESYFPRIYLRDKLVQHEDVFKGRVAQFYEQDLAARHQEAVQNLTKRRAELDQKLADLRLAPDARVTEMERVRLEGEALDAVNPDAVDRISTINDLRKQKKAALGAGDRNAAFNLQKAIDAETAAGGDALKLYRAERRRLRSRRRDLDFNFAGQAERETALLNSLADLEEANVTSLNRLVAKGQALERDLQRLDPAKRDEKISALRTSFIQLAERADAALDRQAKALTKMEEKAKADAAAGKPASDVEAEARKRVEKEIAAQRNRSERMTSLADRLEALEGIDIGASRAELREAVDTMIREISDLTLSRGERAQRLKDRMAKTDPDRVAAREKALAETRASLERKFDEQWRKNLDEDGVGLTGAAKTIGDDVWDNLTGRNYGEDGIDTADLHVPITRGPLKDRTFNVPDTLIEDFLDGNITNVSERYGRTMAAELELTRKFGRADMRDQFQAVKDDYARLRDALDARKPGGDALVTEVTDLYVKVTGETGDVSKRKLRAFLDKREKLDVKNLESMRDLIRGTKYGRENGSVGGRVLRGVQTYNYIRSMGGIIPGNLSDLYRPAMVHGLRAFLSEGLLPMLTNMKAVKLSIEDARTMGLATEMMTQHRLMNMGEVGDPYRAGSPVERLLNNGARVGSRWNGIAMLTDFTQGLSATMSQNRILRGVGDPASKDSRFLAYLGIDAPMAARIAAQFAEHGETSQTIKIANTRSWTDEEALRAYRGAVRKDVDSIIVNKSVGDIPLLANHPIGKAIVQFRTYALASHQRVLLRGMQESKRRFVSGLVMMSALGMMSATLAALRGGNDRFEKFKNSAANPAFLIGEGLDRSGFFALPMEMANEAEVIGRSTGYSFNPVKSPLLLAGRLAAPDAPIAANSGRVAQRGWLGATMGPTFGLVDEGLGRGVKAASNAAQGKMTVSDKRAVQALVPFGSYVGMKEMLQVLSGDSPYLPQPAEQ